MAFIPEDAQTQRPATVNRTATLYVFPVTDKAPKLIEAFRFGCSLISLLCVLVKLQ
jgi:ribosome biogenesis protein Tsr3